jgi:hypothetical protein
MVKNFVRIYSELLTKTDYPLFQFGYVTDMPVMDHEICEIGCWPRTGMCGKAKLREIVPLFPIER